MNANKNTMVIRNGRSTSQVSIYNYPEHLNPFYEDDNHKRLRFWNFGKSKNNDLRRNSFSFSAIRGIWDFKSLRLKKKSSSLGINKTSESPPMLRRPIIMPENQFERTDSSRRSLQNIHFSEYKANPKSFTMQPKQNLVFYENKNNESRLSLTNSIASNGSESSNFLRTPTIRKKSKAPPIPINNNNDVLLKKRAQDENQNQNNSENKNSNQGNMLEIANLTAEIENFCKAVCLEEPMSLDEIQTNEANTSNSNNNSKCKLNEIKKSEHQRNDIVISQENHKNNEVITEISKDISSKKNNNNHIEKIQKEDPIENKQLTSNEQTSCPENLSDVSKHHTHLTHENRIEIDQKINKNDEITNKQTSCPENLSDVAKHHTNLTQENASEIDQKINKSDEITTHFDIESERKEKCIHTPQDDKFETKISQFNFKLPVNSIHNSSELIIREPELDNDLEHNYQRKNYSSQTCTLAPLRDNVSRNKTSLVKDIIESISRNQRLLNGCSFKTQANLEKNENKIDEQVKILNPMVEQESDYSQELNKIDNNEILIKDQIKKKSFYNRESSPTANNLDWNPVPKPKRVKNYPYD